MQTNKTVDFFAYIASYEEGTSVAPLKFKFGDKERLGNWHWSPQGREGSEAAEGFTGQSGSLQGYPGTRAEAMGTKRSPGDAI